jgi:hypothetical protein
MKKLSKLGLVILGVLCVLIITKDLIIKAAITTAASKLTGAPVTIDKFSLGLMKQSVRIEGLRMGNPEGFSSATLIDLPRIAVAWDVGAFLKGKLHLKLLDIELRELAIETNKDGKLNVDSLNITHQQQKKETKPLAMQIDQLDLTMGKIVMSHYSAGKEPAVKVFDINLKKSYKDITSAQQLAVFILAEPMKQAGIKGAAKYGEALLKETGVLSRIQEKLKR